MNAPAPSQSADFDNLLSPDNLRDPFPLYAWLREESPVHWNAHFGTWLLTRYSDVRAAFSDRTRFSSEVGRAMLARVSDFPPEVMSDFNIGYRFFYRQIQALDPPDHTLHRSLIGKAFTPRVIENLRPMIQARVDRLIAELMNKEEADFVHDFAYPLPSLVIFDLLGVPEDQYSSLRTSASAFARFPHAIYSRDFAALSEIARNLVSTQKLLANLIEQRRRSPQNDLISALATVQEGDSTLSEDEIVVLCNFLLFAGHETTANLLGGSVLHLLNTPPIWHGLTVEGEIPASAIEELLRFISPVLTISRVLTEDVELHGKLMKRGDRVQLGVGAANHDGAQFSDPEELKLDRSNPNSLAFGHGVHYCIGAVLARLEAQIALGSLLKRVPGMNLLKSSAEYNPVFYLRSLKSLPISVG